MNLWMLISIWRCFGGIGVAAVRCCCRSSEISALDQKISMLGCRRFYVGTSSFEEGASVQDCCVFRGSLAKLDIRTGAIIWKTHVLPDDGGKPRRRGHWGSSPSIDKPQNLVFATTGNLYSAPQRVAIWGMSIMENVPTTNPTGLGKRPYH
ncbi:hypothetical protein Scep_021807 [Stephania cephalantha]|uniref:Uncharacterized protein n=1 Tax=Stephania cephalantha TaxID=152367 RepID=A0AAP0FCC9_9MAGN